MLGQHPRLYAFPEMNLFVGQTVGELLALFRLVRPRSLDGLCRAVAELELGAQTEEGVTEAQRWLEAHRAWSGRQVLEHLASHLGEAIWIDKSPSTVIVRRGLENALAAFPEAHFLHLTRHPISTCLSIHRLAESTRLPALAGPARDPEDLWHGTNASVSRLARRLPPGQYMQVRGEDVLGEPALFLPQVCEWLDVGCDAGALEAMRHPERSPYARLGPASAPFGNDPNFLRNPGYTGRPIVLPTLDAPLEWRAAAAARRLRPATAELARQYGYV